MQRDRLICNIINVIGSDMAKTIDNQSFWSSMTMGLSAQEYVNHGLALVRSLNQNTPPLPPHHDNTHSETAPNKKSFSS